MGNAAAMCLANGHRERVEFVVELRKQAGGVGREGLARELHERIVAGAIA